MIKSGTPVRNNRSIARVTKRVRRSKCTSGTWAIAQRGPVRAPLKPSPLTALMSVSSLHNYHRNTAPQRFSYRRQLHHNYTGEVNTLRHFVHTLFNTHPHGHAHARILARMSHGGTCAARTTFRRAARRVRKKEHQSAIMEEGHRGRTPRHHHGGRKPTGRVGGVVTMVVVGSAPYMQASSHGPRAVPVSHGLYGSNTRTPAA